MKKLYDEPYFEVLRFFLDNPLCVSNMEDEIRTKEEDGEDISDEGFEGDIHTKDEDGDGALGNDNEG